MPWVRASQDEGEPDGTETPPHGSGKLQWPLPPAWQGKEEMAQLGVSAKYWALGLVLGH